MPGGESSYIEKQKRNHDDHLRVCESTLSFVKTVKRETYLVMRYTLFIGSNHHCFSEAQLFLIQRSRIYFIHCLNTRVVPGT